MAKWFDQKWKAWENLNPIEKIAQFRHDHRNLLGAWEQDIEDEIQEKGQVDWVSHALKCQELMEGFSAWAKGSESHLKGIVVNWARKYWTMHFALDDLAHPSIESVLQTIGLSKVQDRWQIFMSVVNRLQKSPLEYSPEEWLKIKGAIETLKLENFNFLMAKNSFLPGVPYFGDGKRFQWTARFLYELIQASEQDPSQPSIFTRFFLYHSYRDLKKEAYIAYVNASTPDERKMHFKRLFLWDQWSLGFLHPQVKMNEVHQKYFNLSFHGNETSLKNLSIDLLELYIGEKTVFEESKGLNRQLLDDIRTRITPGYWEDSWNSFVGQLGPEGWNSRVSLDWQVFKAPEEYPMMSQWVSCWVSHSPLERLKKLFTPQERHDRRWFHYSEVFKKEKSIFQKEEQSRVQRWLFMQWAKQAFAITREWELTQKRRGLPIQFGERPRTMALLKGFEDPTIWIELGQKELKAHGSEWSEERLVKAYHETDWKYWLTFQHLHEVLEVCLQRVCVTVGGQVWGKELGLAQQWLSPEEPSSSEPTSPSLGGKKRL